MRTPAGKECRYYYEDFNRGRSTQECRLLIHRVGDLRWKPGDCSRCPVPDILWANSSEHLALHAELRAGFLGLGRTIVVTAVCRKHDLIIEDPYAGCKDCARERPDLAEIFS